MNAKHINPKAPLVQKVAVEVVFRRFQAEEVDFFNRTNEIEEKIKMFIHTN